MRRFRVLGVLVAALVLTSCAGKEIPEAYRTPELEKAVQTKEIAAYLDGLRVQYTRLRQSGILSAAEFGEAVFADTQATKLWNEYVELVRAGDDTQAHWVAISSLITTLEGIILKVVEKLDPVTPAVLGELRLHPN